MMKLFLLGLAFIVCLSKADVSHIATNEYLPPEQPKPITHEPAPTYRTREVNFNVHPPPSASSAPLQQTPKEYHPRLAQIESIQPSIHIASFSVRTTVPFPQTYSQQPTQSSDTKQTSSYSYNPQAQFPQTPVQQSHSPLRYASQEYPSAVSVPQQHTYPRPAEIPTVSSKTDQRYLTSPVPINQDPQTLQQQTQQSYENYRVDHHSLVPSPPVQRNYLPPTQSAYTPQLSYQEAYSPASLPPHVYSPPSPVAQAPSSPAPTQNFYSSPVPNLQDYSTQVPVQQSSFIPEVSEQTVSSQTPAQPSYQQQTYTTSEPVQQTSEHLQYSPPSYPQPPTEHNELPPQQPQQYYVPSTNEYPRTSEIYSTSNNVQQSYEHRSTIQQPVELQSPSQQPFISSTNTQSTFGQPQPTYKTNSSPDRGQETYSPPTPSETPSLNQQFNSPPTYNYQAPSSAFQQQTYSAPIPERIQKTYLPPAPVKPMNPYYPVYSPPARLQQQFVQVNEESHKQISPATQPKPLEPVYRTPAVSREAYSSAPMRPQQDAVPPLSGSYNNNAVRAPSSGPAPKAISSYQPIYEAPVPSQLAYSYEVSSSSPIVEPYSYYTPARNSQASANSPTVETQQNQDTPRQSPISDVSFSNYRPPTEHKSQSSIQTTQIHRSPSQTLQERPESSSQTYNKPQQVETFDSHTYKSEHSAMAPHSYESLAPKEMFNFFPQPMEQSQSDYSYRAPVNSATNMEIKSRDAPTNSKETTKLSAVKPVQKSGPSFVPEPPPSAPSNRTEYASNGGYTYRRQ